MELTLTNFQGWRSATLTLEGFTAIVGPSNRGKSSFVRSLRAALRNELTENHIHMGQKEARVALSLDDHEIEISRKAKASATYVVDGVEFSKLGGGIPPEMSTWGYQPVDVNGVRTDPICARQFDPQFLLSSSPAETSAILNAFSSTERLDQGKKTLKGYISTVDSEAKLLGSSISAMEVQVADLTVRATKAEELRAELVEKMEVARRLNRTSACLMKLRQVTPALDRTQQQIAAIQDVDAVRARVDRALRAADAFYRLVRAVQLQERVRQALKALEQVDPCLDSTLKHYLCLERLVRLHIGQQKQQQIETVTAALGKVSEPMDRVAKHYTALVRLRALLLSDPQPLRDRAAAIADLSPRVTGLQTQQRQLQAFIQAHAATDAHEKAAGQLSSLSEDLAANHTNIEAAEAELLTYQTANQIVTCPKCHHEFVAPHEDHHD